MHLTTSNLESHCISTVHLDFDLSLEFDDGSTVAFSELRIGREVYDEDTQFEGLRHLVRLLGSVCVDVRDAGTGRLSLGFNCGTTMSAHPRAEVESWEYCSPDGSTMLCLPGGEIETLPGPARVSDGAPRPTEIAEGSTVVRISVGRRGGIEFSNRSVLGVEVPLDDAYLILRESVSSVRLVDGTTRVKLSSGYVL